MWHICKDCDSAVLVCLIDCENCANSGTPVVATSRYMSSRALTRFLMTLLCTSNSKDGKPRKA